MTRVPFMKPIPQSSADAFSQTSGRAVRIKSPRDCTRFYSNVAEDSAWTWWFGWIADVHWKLRSTSKKKWTVGKL